MESTLEERIESLKDAEGKIRERRQDVETELALPPTPHPEIVATLRKRIECLKGGERKFRERRQVFEAKLKERDRG
ncbi:hypothetical protein HQ586_03260 [Candidatus Bathyarchaeota archaeon]|nr:hypothetical protein [Candidatus Bathyarchaeota archaeon]